ncbi:hypothetical protein RUM8411_01064 [Ruegeria meonggei]|uniref:Uncharacterized protein n=1 Tax=Ruegeria meonggei TaxID=1446476 RepID=A0A1X6YNX7_9RHOB|nr:hypothetical protein RUM8411_01064 [Ruegeria meonggei]
MVFGLVKPDVMLWIRLLKMPVQKTWAPLVELPEVSF